MKPLVLTAAAALLCALAVPAALADPAVTGYPSSIASTGDSITRAFNTCSFPFVDCPANSWSTGTSSTVNSHYRRILAANPAISGRNYNDAKTGARMSGLLTQVQAAVSQHAEYVTVLMGANDVCTSSESTMTPVDTLRSQLRGALATLSAGSPNARIYVVSIPDVYHLWQILHTNLSAVLDVDVRRHLPVAARQSDVDLVRGQRPAPARAAALDRRQRRDRGRVRRVHPLPLRRRRRLRAPVLDRRRLDARLLPPVHLGTGQGCERDLVGRLRLHGRVAADLDGRRPRRIPRGGTDVTLSATDNAGVSGIEYRLGSATAWTRYNAPVTVPTGTSITFRAVDVNGNSEATQTLTP